MTLGNKYVLNDEVDETMAGAAEDDPAWLTPLLFWTVSGSLAGVILILVTILGIFVCCCKPRRSSKPVTVEIQQEESE